MALRKTVALENGVQANYHRISGLRLRNSSKDTYQMLVSVESFVNKGFRDADLENLVHNQSFVFEIPKDALMNAGPFAVAYKRLKALPLFEGAENV